MIDNIRHNLKKSGFTHALRSKLSSAWACVRCSMIFRTNRGHKLSAGFTVVEALVALGILVVGLSGGFAAVSLSLNRSTLSKEQVTAFYLAQEAMEIVRYTRDSNSLAGSPWLSGFAEDAGDPCGGETVCRVDATSFAWTSCGSTSWGNCPVLRQHNTLRLYTHSLSNTTDTIYKREIKVVKPSVDLIEVEVRVTWNHTGEPQSFIVTGIFYDFR